MAAKRNTYVLHHYDPFYKIGVQIFPKRTRNKNARYFAINNGS